MGTSDFRLCEGQPGAVGARALVKLVHVPCVHVCRVCARVPCVCCVCAYVPCVCTCVLCVCTDARPCPHFLCVGRVGCTAPAEASEVA